MLEKIVSGGQTGVDRAALDAAMETGLACGGWCPKGRRAVDGPIPRHYPLKETLSTCYRQRTEWNVRDADGTLVLNSGPLQGGTAYTVRTAREMKRPYLILDLEARPDADQVLRWLDKNRVRVLNVAGPREQRRPGSYEQARAFLTPLLNAIEGRAANRPA